MDATQRISAAEYRNMLLAGGDPAQSLKNKQSNDRGMAFEKLLVNRCEYYSRQGKAEISKTPEPYRCIEKLEGWFKGIFTAKAEPDFKGALKSGRAIVFEAKSTQKNRIKWDALTDNQMRKLDKYALMNAMTFVCVNINERYFTVPWRKWRDMKKYYTRKYLMIVDITEYEVKYDALHECVRFLEYLNGLIV